MLSYSKNYCNEEGKCDGISYDKGRCYYWNREKYPRIKDFFDTFPGKNEK